MLLLCKSKSHWTSVLDSSLNWEKSMFPWQLPHSLGTLWTCQIECLPYSSLFISGKKFLAPLWFPLERHSPLPQTLLKRTILCYLTILKRGEVLIPVLLTSANLWIQCQFCWSLKNRREKEPHKCCFYLLLRKPPVLWQNFCPPPCFLYLMGKFFPSEIVFIE